jgi:DNA polymerase III delta subunit
MTRCCVRKPPTPSAVLRASKVLTNARSFAADANFDWGTLLQAGASMSLFSEKRLLELRLPSGKPGDKGAAALHRILLASR